MIVFLWADAGEGKHCLPGGGLQFLRRGAQGFQLPVGGGKKERRHADCLEGGGANPSRGTGGATSLEGRNSTL